MKHAQWCSEEWNARWNYSILVQPAKCSINSYLSFMISSYRFCLDVLVFLLEVSGPKMCMKSRRHPSKELFSVKFSIYGKNFSSKFSSSIILKHYHTWIDANTHKKIKGNYITTEATWTLSPSSSWLSNK